MRRGLATSSSGWRRQKKPRRVAGGRTGAGAKDRHAMVWIRRKEWTLRSTTGRLAHKQRADTRMFKNSSGEIDVRLRRVHRSGPVGNLTSARPISI